MTDTAQSGYERDLQKAELTLLQSGNDPLAYAAALRDYFAAHRNYTQGAMVPMFVQMVERVLDDKLSPVVSGIGGLQVSIAYLNSEFQSLSIVVNTLARDMIESKLDRVEIHHEINTLHKLVDTIKAQLDEIRKATQHDNENA
jgi:hypothetical protein